MSFSGIPPAPPRVRRAADVPPRCSRTSAALVAVAAFLGAGVLMAATGAPWPILIIASSAFAFGMVQYARCP